MEAHHAHGPPVVVIRSEGFRMPRNDTEMLLQSHVEGGWVGDGDWKRALPFHSAVLDKGGPGREIWILVRFRMSPPELKAPSLTGLLGSPVPQSLPAPAHPLLTRLISALTHTEPP